MPQNMGFPFSVASTRFKRKNRWIFSVGSHIGINAMPAIKGGRPSVTFKDITVEHTSETITFPGKPDWQPIELTLYDYNQLRSDDMFDWLVKFYNPQSENNTIGFASNLKENGCLELFDGCGNTIEKWILESCYPQRINWGELDYTSSDITTVDVTIKYDRAYQIAIICRRPGPTAETFYASTGSPRPPKIACPSMRR